MPQLGSYGRGEIEILVEHDNTVLAEIQDFKYDFDVPKVASGSGLGDLKNKRFKRTGAAKGTWSMSRNMLSNADNGDLLVNLLSGSAHIISEAITISSATYTPSQTLVSILSIQYNTSLTLLEDGVDYTVNYATGVITFTTATAEAATIMYLSTDADLTGDNMVQDGGFESDTTNIWSAVSCTFARSTTSPYVGTYKGALTAINAQGDGLQYDPNIAVVPGRTYRFSFYAKAAAADACQVQWTDASGAASMTPVGTAATFSTSWKLHEFTFVPDDATILTIQIQNNAVAPGATLDIDEVWLRENAPLVNPMDAGKSFGFTFNVVARRVEDGSQVARFIGCEAFKDSGAAGDIWKEDISGEFLDYEGEG